MRAGAAVMILNRITDHDMKGWKRKEKEAFRFAKDFLASNAEDLDAELEEDEWSTST